MVQRRARHTAGFTLVELLIVMALLGLVSALLFGGLRFTARAAADGSAIVERASDLTLAANFLRGALADARPLPRGPDDPVGGVDFAGGEHQLALIGAPPAYLAPGGFYRIEIGLTQDDRRRRLAASWMPLGVSDGLPSPAPFRHSPLLDDVARVEFGYFGRLAAEDSPSWHPEWQGMRSLPALVRLRIVFADGAHAPDLIVAVRTSGGPRR